MITNYHGDSLLDYRQPDQIISDETWWNNTNLSW